jgi:DNA primase
LGRAQGIFDAERVSVSSEVSVDESSFMLSKDERRRLFEANVAAAMFFRRELLRATTGWPVEYLKSRGVGEVLSTASDWKVGYAPDSWTRLVDFLHGEGFGNGTLVRAGLVSWSDVGDAVDRHRDRLMLLSLDHRLAPSGFVEIGPDGHVQAASPASVIHRPSNALVGVAEQLELLSYGAVPVIVDDPLDAIAITSMSRQFGGQWAGIPVCGAGLSTAQARMLRHYAATDRVVVVLSGDQAERNQSAGYLLDLAFFFDRVRAVELPASPAALSKAAGGAEALHESLSNARPLMTYRASGAGFGLSRDLDPDPPDRGPGL